ncbi:MAG TPA: ComEC/Rec2 family competence protein, partial [Bryobacteraceae bacterium]|nr:ComEC/Rec2 family competence protein [Bryobacteraceae bacterium]
LMVCSLAGILTAVLHRPPPAPTVNVSSRETALLSGCVVEPSIFYAGRDQFTLELAPGASARVTLAMKDGEAPPDLMYGQALEFEARLRSIRNFHNPGAFDFVNYSARRKIYWTASVSPGAEIKRLPGRCGSLFWKAIFDLRSAALRRIDQLYAGNEYADGMMQAILIGETTKIDKVWTEHFRRTGTFHALVISGLHITVIAGFLLLLLRVCFVPEIPALAATAVVAWLYALVTGCNAPVVRASAAFTVFLIGRYFYRRGRLLNLLAAVAIGYLLYDPSQLFEASFQLSFLSVAALGTLAIPILERTSGPFVQGLRNLSEIRRDPRMVPRVAAFRLELRLLAETLWHYISLPKEWILAGVGLACRIAFYAYETVVLSTAIQIGVALPMAIYFHRVSFTGFSANVFIVPLLTLAVPVGFVAIFTNWSLPARLAELLLSLSEKIATWHVRFEPDWRVPDPPIWLCLAFAAALAALALVMGRSRWLSWPATIAVLVLFGLVYWSPFPPEVQPRVLELTAIDVGQGDSLFLAFPDGKLLLIDGGGILSYGRKTKPKLDIGEDVVSAYLWTRGISHLDVIACSHMHDDHVGGVPALIDNFHPRELWTGATQDSEERRVIEDKARRHGSRIISMTAGRNFSYGGTQIEVLSPPADYEPGPEAKNNDSLVLRVTYGKRVLLLTGDMEKEMEFRLIGDDRKLQSDVLKVGHHGSRTSSTDVFLDAVTPAFAIISDGFENSFGHPHRDVLARLAAHRAGVLRTDTEGLITIRTDGTRLWAETARYLRP